MDDGSCTLLCCLSLLSLLLITNSPFGNCNSDDEIECIPSERDALVRLKHHLSDPSNRLSSWNSSINPNCCHWLGVVCGHLSPHVLQLHLSTHPPAYDYYLSAVDYREANEAYEKSRFGGEISHSLVDLKHLNHLDLSGNDFRGTQIPSFLCEITTLTYLNLSDAGFDGKIPPQIGNLSNLLYLGLTFVAHGTIPYQIGNLTNLLHLDLGSFYDEPLVAENLHWLLGLSSLQYLDLSYANLSKSFDWLQTLQALPSLVDLRLGGCTLSDYYKQSSTLNFSSLASLSIPIAPKWIFRLKKLVSLQFASNFHFHINGSIPDGIQNLTLLENLDLSENSFSSSIPNWLYGLHHLKFLNLRGNNLIGSISDVVGNLTSLISLDLSNNQLEGAIPSSLGNLCNLTAISFSNLKCTRQISEILEILRPCVSHGLKSLRASNAQLLGHLTDQFDMFKNLVILDFSENSIIGTIPPSIGKLPMLRILDFSENQFSGNPFKILGSIPKLFYLSISDNQFQGIVREDDLANFTTLRQLYASGNNITLKVDPGWQPNFQVYRLKMGSWQLGPRFPPWIQSQENLVYLDVSNTRISDSIPTWFWKSNRHVSFLNLSHNHIHGELPNTLRNLENIQTVVLSSNMLHGKLPYLLGSLYWLDLSNNSFSGSMNDFLCQKHNGIKSLEFLNVASNNLSGEIPDCWELWPNLMDVNLESNLFIGNLPLSMGSLAELLSLHTRNNTLSGEFPPILKNTSSLILLDLGENNFTGVIPAWIGKTLIDLKVLRLRSNKFSGNIPNEICDMKFLQDLDLSHNQLSDNIPKCFNQLSAMKINKSHTDSFIREDVPYTKLITAVLWVKGNGVEYRNNLGLVKNIDLSDNKLSGEIPGSITNLSGLIYLNLSKNQLSGHIPHSIGNMVFLESIDLSRNQLSGEIPPTITKLSFLSNLDVSFNHLNGEIPTGTQLQTFNASDFDGNHLCGPPLLINCTSIGEIPNEDENEKEGDGHGVKWFYVSMAFGFIVGFWGVVGSLVIYKSWRYAYFRFLDNMWYKLQSFW